ESKMLSHLRRIHDFSRIKDAIGIHHGLYLFEYSINLLSKKLLVFVTSRITITMLTTPGSTVMNNSFKYLFGYPLHSFNIIDRAQVQKWPDVNHTHTGMRINNSLRAFCPAYLKHISNIFVQVIYSDT